MEIASLLETLNGDFAIIFIDNLNSKIFISKDAFGKRSLLLGFSEEGFCLSSTAVHSCNIPESVEEN